ncbi:MAG: uracil-DNA glycosylase [Flavobacteriaceae bacterium]|nr:uracil-DNA glycosylase [Flavobacteriaceae bacterium]
MQRLLKEIRTCTLCESHLPLGPRPIVTATRQSKIILIGQAPGRKVHESGIAWNDQSGKKLREWLGVDDEVFYNPDNFAVVPMGFCYPGKGKSGDLPPRPECAPTWHESLFSKFTNARLQLVIGAYAANYYLFEDKRNLTDKVRNYTDFLPKVWPLPHPSPVNRFWLSKNPWFESEIVPNLQQTISQLLK